MRVCGFETSKNQKGREPKAHATPVAGKKIIHNCS